MRWRNAPSWQSRRRGPLPSGRHPRRWHESVPERIYGGLAELASTVGLRLVGGDTTLAPEHGTLTLMLLGSTKVEPRMDVRHVAEAVLFMANLPLDANVQFLTVMATKMPFVGRG